MLSEEIELITPRNHDRSFSFSSIQTAAICSSRLNSFTGAASNCFDPSLDCSSTVSYIDSLVYKWTYFVILFVMRLLRTVDKSSAVSMVLFLASPKYWHKFSIYSFDGKFL